MSEGETALTGGCACGAVRYTVMGPPYVVNNCHCRLCQRQTGSTSVVNAFFETERLTQHGGETSRHVVKAGSGNDHVIVRCTNCGTALWSFYPRLGDHALGLRAGTLDDPDAVTPDAVIFVESKMPWVPLPEGIPHFETFYNPAELLPPERLARMKALVAKRATG